MPPSNPPTITPPFNFSAIEFYIIKRFVEINQLIDELFDDGFDASPKWIDLDLLELERSRNSMDDPCSLIDIVTFSTNWYAYVFVIPRIIFPYQPTSNNQRRLWFYCWWIELNNDNVCKGPRSPPAYFKVHVVTSKLRSEQLELCLRSCPSCSTDVCLRCIQNINKLLCV